MTISYVPPESAAVVLNAVAPEIKRALQTGQGDAHTAEEIVTKLLDGSHQLWAVHEGEDIQAVLSVSVPEFQTGLKVFVNMLAGRDMDEWNDEAESALIRYRDEIGANCVEASCRPGLARYLKRRGWKTKAVIMEAPE